MKRSEEVKKQETEQLIAIVVARYVATGKDLTAPEIAEQLGWSETKVRRVLNEHGGCPNGLVMHQEERTSYSKNYRDMASGVHRIMTYGPTRETLRAQIKLQLALRAAEMPARCPHPGCTFAGTLDQVDEHRTSHVHDDEKQAGSNLKGNAS